MVLGLIGIVYGALLAFAQTDIKRLVACTSISTWGFVMIAIYSGSELALQGAVVPDDCPRALGRRPLHPVRPALRAPAHPGSAPDGRSLGTVALPARRDAVLLRCIPRMRGPATSSAKFRSHQQLQVAPVIVIATFGLVLASVYSLIMQQACFGTPREAC